MRTLLLLSVLLMGCTDKTKPGYEHDFAESVITFSIETCRDEYLELPGLYDTPTQHVPDPEDDQLILAEKLITRGFRKIQTQQANFPLLGRRMITATLVNDSCRCEVVKMYYSSSNISEYLRSERIKCTKTN